MQMIKTRQILFFAFDGFSGTAAVERPKETDGRKSGFSFLPGRRADVHFLFHIKAAAAFFTSLLHYNSFPNQVFFLSRLYNRNRNRGRWVFVKKNIIWSKFYIFRCNLEKQAELLW